MTKTKLILLSATPIILCLVAAFLFSVYSPPLDRQRVYRMGFGVNDPPLHSLGADGKPVGLAVSIVTEAARRKGIRLEWIQSATPGIPALEKGEADLWVLMADLPERESQVHFTAPYLVTEYCFLVPADSPWRRSSDLEGERISTLGFGIHQSRLSDILPQARMIYASSPLDAVQALAGGRADAAFLDQFNATALLMDGSLSWKVRLFSAPVPLTYLSLASTFEQSGVADEIREGIRTMSLDGSMEPLMDGRGFFPALNLDATESISTARRRERYMVIGMVSLVILLVCTVMLVLISRRRKARLEETERALLQSEKYYRTLLEVLPDTIYVISADAEHRLSVPVSGMDRSTDAVLRKLLEHSSHRTHLEAVLATGETVVAEEMVAEEKGEQRLLEYRLVPLRDEGGKITAVMGILRDQTLRKQADEQRANLEEQLRQSQRLETVGHLAGGVAHDFNNLLTIVLGHSQLMLGKMDAKHPFQNPIQAISKAALKGAALTRQLLTFSRQYEDKPKVISLNAVVREIEEMLRRLIGEHINVTVSLSPESCLILADKGQIEQVILNLALNSRDAMVKGGNLFIETSRNSITDDFAALCLSVPRGEYITLSVADTGCGMTKEVKERIFEPFFTTKAPGKGTGLGLSTVYGIVKQSGGSINVHSSVGMGTSFRVFFPAVEGAPDPEPLVTGDIPLEGTETILLVEDEADVRKLVSEILEQYGYRVLDAPRGKDAIELARYYGGRIDLLLTDMVLPEMNGLEIIREVRAILPEIKVLRMSGYSDLIGRQIDTTPFIQKPFTADKLLKQLRLILNG